MDRFRTAAQDHSVAGLQAKGAGIGSHIGATLVNDSDNADRRCNAGDVEVVGPRPARKLLTDWVCERGNVFQPLCHCLDTMIVEFQAVEHRRGQPT